MLSPQLNLAFHPNTTSRNKINRRCLIDTGFDGTLIVNDHIASQLRLKTNAMSKVITAGGKAILVARGVALVSVLIEETEQFFELDTLVLPNERIIVGNKFLQLLCKEVGTHVVFNYLQDKVWLTQV